MDDLRCSCFKTYPMLSHNGIHDDYIGEIQKYGHADKPLGINGQPVEYHMFDGTPLYSDKAALEKFWKARQPAGAGLAYSGVTALQPLRQRCPQAGTYSLGNTVYGVFCGELRFGRDEGRAWPHL
jgi:hypothetical protein